MPNTTINLNWLRSFEAAARHLSFTAASRELGLTQTAVSQHMKALELKLGQNLFIRHPKSLELTDIGEAYLPSVREALQTISRSTSGLFGPKSASTVTVRASIACIIWLTPKLAAFHDQHPQIGLKFVTAIWPETSGKNVVDLDVVLAPRQHASHRLEKLSDEYIVPICGNRTEISDVAELTRLSPIHILGFDDHWARYLGSFGLTHDAQAARLIVDTSVAACEMVAAERGCAILIERFAEQAIDTGRPVRIVGQPVPLGQSHYLSRPEQMSPATEAVMDWLRRCFDDNIATQGPANHPVMRP